MLSYIILTYILCLIGGILYWAFVRERLSSSNQKTVLLSVLGLSIIVPLFFMQSTAFFVSPEKPKDEHVYILEESVFIDFCPAGEVLEACYQQATTSEQFCQCDDIVKENILLYEESSFYNFLSWQQTAFWKILLVAASFIFVFVLGSILYLLSLIRSSRKESYDIDGKRFTILYPNRPLSVGSFQLWNRYIIWQEEMFALTQEEKEAILWHEISHIDQKDTWIKVGINLLQVLWFLHPMYYLLRQDLERLSEYIADEWAVEKVGDARQYASLLLKMKTQQQAPAYVQSFNNGQLFKQRIKHILSNPKTHNRSLNILNFIFLTTSFAFISSYTLPIIDTQIGKLQVYQTLSEHNHESGRTTFCKKCLQEELSQGK